METTTSFTGTNSQHARTLQFNNVNWHTNAQGDAIRASQGSTAQPAPTQGIDPPEFPPLTSPSPQAATIEPGCSASGTGTNMIFQHGIFSSCNTWTQRMYPWLKERYQFGTVLIPSLSSIGSCSYSISPPSASLPAIEGSGSFTVTTAAGCAWSATSSDGWLTVVGGSTGSGSGTVFFAVAPNFAPLPRTATISVQTQGFAVTQAGATSCIYVLSPSTVSLTSYGGSGIVTVTTQAGCTWSATSSANWITITAGATGTGSGSFSYSVPDNTLSTGRSGTVSVADRTLTVSQAGVEPPPPPPGGCRRWPCTESIPK